MKVHARQTRRIRVMFVAVPCLLKLAKIQHEFTNLRSVSYGFI